MCHPLLLPLLLLSLPLLPAPAGPPCQPPALPLPAAHPHAHLEVGAQPLPQRQGQHPPGGLVAVHAAHVLDGWLRFGHARVVRDLQRPQWAAAGQRGHRGEGMRGRFSNREAQAAKCCSTPPSGGKAAAEVGCYSSGLSSSGAAAAGSAAALHKLALPAVGAATQHAVCTRLAEAQAEVGGACRRRSPAPALGAAAKLHQARHALAPLLQVLERRCELRVGEVALQGGGNVVAARTLRLVEQALLPGALALGAVALEDGRLRGQATRGNREEQRSQQ